jgi:hypothetical protein
MCLIFNGLDIRARHGSLGKSQDETTWTNGQVATRRGERERKEPASEIGRYKDSEHELFTPY